MRRSPRPSLSIRIYANHGILLVAAGRIERDWTEARLRRTWEEMAPKRWLEDVEGPRGP